MKRLSAIDGLRGLIVIFMVMHHALDAWVHEPERQGDLWLVLRHLGGLPAPGFMFLAGLSAALVAAKERSRGMSVRDRMRIGLKRGLYVLGIAFAFRVVAFAIDGTFYAREWPILFRVDILNCMGVTLALVACLSAFARNTWQGMAIALGIAAAFLLPTPFIYGHQFEWPSPFVGNYIGGVQPLVMFPLFPWAAISAIGYAVGEWIARGLASSKEAPNAVIARVTWPILAVGLFVFSGGIWLGRMPFDLYPWHDYWNASPIFMSMRAGIQLALLGLLAQWWKNDPEGKRGGLLQLLGRHSLFVYLVHIEMVYGRPAWPIQRQLTVAGTLTYVLEMLVGFIIACLLMEWWQARGARPATVTPPTPAAVEQA